MERIRRQLIRPKKILEIEPYKVVMLWSNGEIRVNDFTTDVDKWNTGANKYLVKLVAPKAFMTAFIQENTLAFSGVKVKVPGISGSQPLDLDPDVLYQESKKIGISVSPEEISKPNNPRRKSEKSTFEITGNSIHFSTTDALFVRMRDELIKIEN
jgi:hypothetical protein